MELIEVRVGTVHPDDTERCLSLFRPLEHERLREAPLELTCEEHQNLGRKAAMQRHRAVITLKRKREECQRELQRPGIVISPAEAIRVTMEICPQVQWVNAGKILRGDEGYPALITVDRAVVDACGTG